MSFGVKIQKQFHVFLEQAHARNPEFFASCEQQWTRLHKTTSDLASQAHAYVDQHREPLAMGAFASGFIGLIAIGVMALQPSATDQMAESTDVNLDPVVMVINPQDYPEPEAVIAPAPVELLPQETPDGIATLIENGKDDDVALAVDELTLDAPAIAEDPVIEVIPPEPTRETTTVKVKSGDTLMGVLKRAGVERKEAYYAIEAMKAELDPRKVRAGQEIELTIQVAPEGDAVDALDPLATATVAAAMSAGFTAPEPEKDSFTPALVGMRIKTDVDKHLNITRESAETSVETFLADMEITELQEEFHRAKGTIETSLFVAAEELDIPHGVIVEMIRMYSYDVDFQREIRRGDAFDIFYSRFVDEDGNTVKAGNVYFGDLALRGKSNPYYRFTTPDDQITDYYNTKGQSAKKFLMKTPVDGARLSSGFGRRKHPVLGYVKSHKGTDFAAPRGTPIMAAGNGVIERASRFGSFGNYIKIRHANGYKTAYAHLNGYAKGIKKGKRVKQGQIIGYVGTTGRSTGPHLHYEVHLNGKAVNPMTIRVPTGRKLGGDILTAFNEQRETLMTRMAELPVTTKVKTAQLD